MECIHSLNGKELISTQWDSKCREWVFVFTDGISLRVGSPWRASSNEGIEVGSNDLLQTFGLSTPLDIPMNMLDMVGGKAISSAATNQLGDLKIEFDGALVIEVFNGSSGYEGWQLAIPGQQTIVGMGGGGIQVVCDDA